MAFVGADGERVVCEPPFPPLDAAVRGERAGYEPGPLLDHVRRERTVGVLLVRLGGHAAGVFKGEALTDSKVGSRLVHGRHRKGGSSSGRFARRREGEARAALQAAADVAVRVLVPAVGRLDALVLGGDRRALDEVMADQRLAPLRAPGRRPRDRRARPAPGRPARHAAALPGDRSCGPLAGSRS